MRKYYKKILTLLSISIALSSCDLDINENPNKPTHATPDLMLPAAISTSVYNRLLRYEYGLGDFLVGYQLPGNGVSGFGTQYSYNYTSSSNTTCWTDLTSNLSNYNAMIKTAEEDPAYDLYAGIAHVFRVYCFQLLVDYYGDVPYFESLQGDNNLSPKYDKDSEVYVALVQELDAAIKIFKERNVSGVLSLNGTTDPVFAGNIDKWIRLANNLKLRLLIRARGTSIDSFVQSAFRTFDGGFLTEDALVNPGYNATGQQNPTWTVYHSSVSGSRVSGATYYIPSLYVYSYYDGIRLNDPVRGKLVFKSFPNTPLGVLGDEVYIHPNSTRYEWFVGTGTERNASDAQGIFKSRAAGAPVFFASEIYFLLAEAALYGHELSGDVKTNFEKGIEASFDYLHRYGPDSNLPSDSDPAGDAADYIALNSSSPLVNIDLATTVEQKLEAIITQKYIAFNTLQSSEAWTEFRRTSYPKISGSEALETFVSVQSSSPRSDKLPVRLVYPQAEYSLNSNTPPIANAFSSPIFWDRD